MTTLQVRKGIKVVLIETESAGNLGAVARAMSNMGVKELVLVKPKASLDHNDAKAMSIAAYPLLQEAHIVATLDEALDSCHVALGFTRRLGRQRKQFVDMLALSQFVQEKLQSKQRIALVFGPESRGFNTDEANRCQYLVRIPTTAEHGSLNLAQAVMVTLYETQRSHWKFKAPRPLNPATLSELEGLYGHLEELLTAIHYNDAQNPQRIPRVLRRLLGRAEPTKQEVRILRGICRNTLYQLKKE